jgi:hypothetical protein
VQNEEETYDIACKFFISDYDRENPVTKKKAWEEWLKM